MMGATLRVIAGIRTLDGRPVARRDLVGMNEAARLVVSSRGSHWVGGSVGLACTTAPARLAVGPTVAPASRDARARCVVVFDGRIDNRRELIGELSGGSVDAATDDAGLTLAAYRAWGIACPSRLIGDFAFGLCDEGARRLLCARDPLGVRSVYVLVRDDLVGFATQLCQLRALCRQTPPLDMEYVAERLALGVDRPHSGRTAYRGLSRLEPGHRLWRSAGAFGSSRTGSGVLRAVAFTAGRKTTSRSSAAPSPRPWRAGRPDPIRSGRISRVGSTRPPSRAWRPDCAADPGCRPSPSCSASRRSATNGSGRQRSSGPSSSNGTTSTAMSIIRSAGLRRPCSTGKSRMGRRCSSACTSGTRGSWREVACQCF